MLSPTRIPRLRAALSVLAAALFLSACDWTAYLGDPAHSSAGLDPSIDLATVPKLFSHWQWHPDSPPNRPGGLFSTPVTWQGRVFVGSNEGYFYALDLATGRVLWRRDFGFQPALTCGPQGILSSSAVRDDGNGNPLVYLNAPDGYLYELDGLTGNTVWRSVVQIPSTTTNDSYAWSSPTLANGMVYIGISSSCDTPFTQGKLKAYDQQRGGLLATYKVVPDGETGGGIWTTAATDGGAMYVTTGSATDELQPGNQQSLVKLDASTLTELGVFHIPLADRTVQDLDWGSSPLLFTAQLGGQSVQMVGACAKNGIFYALRTDTMALVWKRLIGTATPDGLTGCLSGGVWDGSRLFVGSNATTLRGVAYGGAVRELDPATGSPIWERGLPSNTLGSGSINFAGVLAYATTDFSAANNAVYLINSSNGRILRTLTDYNFPDFAQPVWADGKLLTTSTDAMQAWSW